MNFAGSLVSCAVQNSASLLAQKVRTSASFPHTALMVLTRVWVHPNPWHGGPGATSGLPIRAKTMKGSYVWGASSEGRPVFTDLCFSMGSSPRKMNPYLPKKKGGACRMLHGHLKPRAGAAFPQEMGKQQLVASGRPASIQLNSLKGDRIATQFP